MKSYRQLLLANRAWAQEMVEGDPDFFTRQTMGQQPEVLWIGCSDSRVSPEAITRTLPGELFLHRNVANLVDPDDTNFMAVLQYAVTALKVRHIVVCGHHACGGLKATLEGGAEGPIGKWLENARNVYHAHRDEIDGRPDAEARLRRLVECNVRDQLLTLARTDIVQAAFASGQPLELHGWVYDLRDGELKPMIEVDATTDLAALGAPEPVLV